MTALTGLGVTSPKQSLKLSLKIPRLKIQVCLTVMLIKRECELMKHISINE